MATYAACETERKRILGLGRKIQVRLVKKPFMGVDSTLATLQDLAVGGGNDTHSGIWPGQNDNAGTSYDESNNYMLQVKFPPGGPQMGVGALSDPTNTQLGTHTINNLYYWHSTASKPVTHADSAVFKGYGGGVNGIITGISFGAPANSTIYDNKARLGGTRTGGWHMYHIDHASTHFENNSVIATAVHIA